MFFLKIVSMAIFFAFFCRNSTNDEETSEYIDDNRFDLENDEDHLHSYEVCFFLEFNGENKYLNKFTFFRIILYLILNHQNV